ncbi:MAG: C13 family peptidase [Candidatus Heimdallarchaeaceae archaeon]
MVTSLLIACFSLSISYYQPVFTSEAANLVISTDDPLKLTPASETQSAWILMAGDVEHHNDTEAMRNGCNKTYDILREKGFSPEKIFYMGPEVSSSQPYVNTSSTVVNMQWAIEEWAPLHVNSSQSLGIYLISHGDINALGVMVADALWANDLSSFLDNFEVTTGCKRIIVVIEGCHSGSFINNLSKDNRIIVTSTSTNQGAAFNADRTWGAFSECFWSTIASCGSIGKAFDDGIDHIRALGCNQSPKLDDNHDDYGTTCYPNDDLPTGGEGFDALDTYIWAKPIMCPPKLKIMQVPLHMYEIYDPFTCSAVIEVEIENPAMIDKVYARFMPVEWEPYDPVNGFMYPINDDEVQMIELESPSLDEVYMGDVAFDGLSLGVSFKVNILAYDTNGYVADIVSTYLTFNVEGMTPTDIIAPSVHIVNPDSDDIVKNTIEVTVTGDDNQKLENIDLYLDGTLVKSIPMPDYYPYPEINYECDTTAYAEGIHNFTAVAIDHQGLTNQTSVLITFRNVEPQPTQGYSILIGTGAIVLISSIASIRVRKKRKLR